MMVSALEKCSEMWSRAAPFREGLAAKSPSFRTSNLNEVGSTCVSAIYQRKRTTNTHGFRALSGFFWGSFGVSWTLLGHFWGSLDHLVGLLEASWTILDLIGAILGPF